MICRNHKHRLSLMKLTRLVFLHFRFCANVFFMCFFLMRFFRKTYTFISFWWCVCCMCMICILLYYTYTYLNLMIFYVHAPISYRYLVFSFNICPVILDLLLTFYFYLYQVLSVFKSILSFKRIFSFQNIKLINNIENWNVNCIEFNSSKMFPKMQMQLQSLLSFFFKLLLFYFILLKHRRARNYTHAYYKI